jgi:RNA polymerase sigma factor (sigma-70 family)
MTVIVAESTRGTGDLGAAGTNATGCGYPTPTAEPVSDTVGVARPARFVGQSDPPGPPRRTTNAELTARFERDVIPLRAPLYRRAMRLTRNRADAENLLQDTMLSAYVGFHRFREGTNLNAWLHRILTNNYIDTYRQTQRQPVVYLRAEITEELVAANVHTLPLSALRGGEALRCPTPRSRRPWRHYPNNSAWSFSTPTFKISNTGRSPKSCTSRQEQ